MLLVVFAKYSYIILLRFVRFVVSVALTARNGEVLLLAHHAVGPVHAVQILTNSFQ